MGVFLTVIGCTDLVLMGDYLWKRQSWLSSPVCRLAGVMALVSSQVSAFTICLITLDRLLVLRFPLHREWHMTRNMSVFLCSAVWLVCISLSVIPLLPAHYHWRFYSQNAICLPLPITRNQFPGQQFAFSVFIVLNFILFLIVGMGQVLIYVTVSNTSGAGR